MKFRKKPVIVEAFKYGEDTVAALDWSESLTGINQSPLFIVFFSSERESGLYIKTLEGDMHVSVGDWIIQGVQGEFYPCKSDIFEKTYEAVE